MSADRIRERVKNLTTGGEMSELPPFPERIMVEISNYCNHGCEFCAYRKMERTKGMIDPDFFRRIVREARELGAREIGLHTGAEPFAHPQLHEFVRQSREAGFEYVYLSTNGSLATPERLRQVIDAGLHSIKFSINAGDRETYRKVHGRDHFDQVMAHVRYVDSYRKERGLPLYLSVSFVEYPANTASLPALRETLAGVVDEIFTCQAVNPSGQMPELPPMPQKVCNLPFKATHVTFEGYLRACCNDYHNYTVVADLNRVSLAEAWASEAYRALRRGFMQRDLAGTLCHNCLTGRHDPVQPLNPELCPYGMI